MRRNIAHLIWNLAACALLVIGFVVYWLPIPIGALMMACGLTILIGRNHAFAARIRRARARHARLNRLFLRIQSAAPAAIGHALAKSDPASEEVPE